MRGSISSAPPLVARTSAAFEAADLKRHPKPAPQ